MSISPCAVAVLVNENPPKRTIPLGKGRWQGSRAAHQVYEATLQNHLERYNTDVTLQQNGMKKQYVVTVIIPELLRQQIEFVDKQGRIVDIYSVRIVDKIKQHLADTWKKMEKSNAAEQIVAGLRNDAIDSSLRNLCPATSHRPVTAGRVSDHVPSGSEVVSPPPDMGNHDNTKGTPVPLSPPHVAQTLMQQTTEFGGEAFVQPSSDHLQFVSPSHSMDDDDWSVAVPMDDDPADFDASLFLWFMSDTTQDTAPAPGSFMATGSHSLGARVSDSLPY